MKELCCVSGATFVGFVNILLPISSRQSRGVFTNWLNILLCIFLGLVFSKIRYFVTVFGKVLKNQSLELGMSTLHDVPTHAWPPGSFRIKGK